jgi:S-DNA-T family DNA segregation ATPase FtsK/SpoIIIE
MLRALVKREGSLRTDSAVPEAVRDALGRRLSELGGLSLIALSAAVGLALATWSAQDPSINHATSGAVHNALGAAGAMTADVLMQMAGLGAIGVILPIAAWGWRLMRHRVLDREKLRLVTWVLGIVFAAGFAATLPPSRGWPLPSGLGGIMGDTVARLPQLFLNSALGWPMAVTSILFGSVTVALVCVACGAGFHEPVTLDDDDILDDAPVTSRPAQPLKSPVPVEDYDEEDEESFSSIPLGLIAHWWFSLRSGVQRKLRGGAFMRPRHDARRIGVHDVLERLDREDATPSRQATRPVQLQVDHDNESPFDENDDTYLVAPLESTPRPNRVTPPAAPPRAGQRIRNEQQPSLLKAEEYELPPLTLLTAPKKSGGLSHIKPEALENNARMLEGVLEDFGVKGQIINVRPGPVVTLYELEPAPGIKSSRVIGLADDIARSMSAVSARVAVVPGRNAIGIELPNARRETVYLRELLASEDFEKSKMRLPLCMGKTIGGEPVITELARMPHLLIAGTTGSGKSVAINTMILSLLYRLKPQECRLIMVDPKMLELSVYDGIPHLLTPVVTDPKKAVTALKWAVREMEERYRKMSKVGVRNIEGFNARVVQAQAKGEVITRTVQTGFDRATGEAVYEREDMDLQPLPFIVVIVDEMADLMMVAGKEIEGTIQRLAQMARAAGIHVVLATQRPSVDVITGTIKANFPTRVSFQVTSKIDSRTILGEQGAEQLLGQGDMLYMAGGGRISRVHGPFVSDEEVEHVVAHLKAQGMPDYLEDVTIDAEEAPETGDKDGAVFDKGAFGDPAGDLYDQAIAIVMRDKKCSTSYIQRRLGVGYNKAASLIERMEKEGIISKPNHAGKREILVEDDERAAEAF